MNGHRDRPEPSWTSLPAALGGPRDPLEWLLGGLIAVVLLGLQAVIGGTVRLLVRRRKLTLAALAAVQAARLGYTRPLLIAASCLVGGLWLWALLHPPSFRAWAGPRLRSAWRGWWIYRRRWIDTMAAHGLIVTRGQAEPQLPRLGRVRSRGSVDRVPVRLASGQCPDDFARAADRLAHAFHATGCRVQVRGPQRITLVFAHGDPLARIVPALPIPRAVNLAAVPVGMRDDGTAWAIRLLGSHLLIAGASGSGKGSVLWSLLRGLAPDIASGRVAVWALDPKGGMELSLGGPLFQRFCDTTAEDMADLLEDAVRVMDARAARLKGRTRLHEPTVADPLLLVVVDEIASLTAYVIGRATKTRLGTALGLLLSKGRAVGVLVVGAVQDPRKDTLPMRDLFGVRVALRLPEQELVDMVLGDGSWARGATADTIPLSTPGAGYVVLDGDPDPVRVRAGHVTDTDLRAMAASYPAPEPVLAAPPRPSGEDRSLRDRTTGSREPRPTGSLRVAASASAEPKKRAS